MIKSGKFKQHPVKFVIGLGNPGNEYANTYHNVGMLFLDYLGGEGGWLEKDGFLYFKKPGLAFAKTNSFMNDSGTAVSLALKLFKFKIKETLIVHDDADLTLGTYKISFDRGAAGHRGVLSIMKICKSTGFWRLRIGIRNKADKNKKAGDIVLKKIGGKEDSLLRGVFQGAAQELGVV